MWSMGIGGLAFGTLGMVGGTVMAGDVGPLVVGYGLLVALAALYLVAGLAVRERVWRRLSVRAELPAAERLVGRRVF